MDCERAHRLATGQDVLGADAYPERSLQAQSPIRRQC